MGLQEIARAIKKARKQAKLTQVQVADKVNINVNYYARIERGEVQPALDTLTTIGKILKIKFTV